MVNNVKLNDVMEFSKDVLGNDSTGHDFFHAQRVAQLAVTMYKKDFPNFTSNDINLILIMGYLHDVVDDKIINDIPKQLDAINQLPSVKNLTQIEYQELLYTIQHLSYSKNIDHHYELSIRGQYIQDADRIDALGAIGIARAFAYGGKKGNLLHDPNIKFSKSNSKQEYRTKHTTTINHFYEKLLTLEFLMNTPQGKEIARIRTNYMKDFLDEFFYEWGE